MNLKCGIVGLPKRKANLSLFNALSNAAAEAAKFSVFVLLTRTWVLVAPFRDERLDKLTELVRHKRTIRQRLSLWISQGWSRVASEGKGKGQRIPVTHQRSRHIVHVVRCFC